MGKSSRGRLFAVLGSVFLCCAVTLADVPPAGRFNPHPGPPQDTPELIIFFQPGEDVAQFAAEHGLSIKQTLRSDRNAYVLVADSVASAVAQRGKAAADRRVRRAYINQLTQYQKMAFVPNDPYFHKNTPSPGWWGQWHLTNEFVGGRDAGVQAAWNNNITGAGIIIGICDDSVEALHPDLSPNLLLADSWDFGQDDNDPSPVWSTDQHGCSVAGVAAARGGNGIGVTGAAPYANLAGLRIDFNNQTTAMFVDATLYHSSGSNTNIKVKNHSYGYSVPYITASADVDALVTSAASGTIHCVAAGNERGGSAEDANTQDLQNSPECICVAALGSDGLFASYSDFGACVTVTCPSNTSGGYGIITTDRMGEANGYNGSGDSFPDGNYTSQFGGTSSATPLAAGVMALVKQVQPALNVRFAKHLLARTSRIVDPGDISDTSDGGWKTNAAGIKFNQNYGFGLIDAGGLTQTAVQYAGVTSQTNQSTGSVNVNVGIPDNNIAGITRTFNISASTPLEEILVSLVITHKNRGQLEARLKSPQGTTSRLIGRNTSDSTDNINWTFVSNAFWGENPAGNWSLTISDLASPFTGKWISYSTTVRMGQLIPVQLPPTITVQPADQAVMVGDIVQFSIQASSTSAPTYQWQKDGSNLADGGRIGGSATDTLTLSNCDFADEGSYRCVVTNPAGSIASDAATLTVSRRYASGDFDRDDDVDTEDFAYLQRCLTGTGTPLVDLSCQAADLNGDTFVDGEDTTIFVNCQSGPDLPANVYCGG